MSAKLATFCISAFGILAFTSAYAGEYIPKSYYIISDGHKSDTVYLRSKRSLYNLMRKKRGVNYNAPPTGGSAYIPHGIPSPEQFFSQAQDFVNALPYAGNIKFPDNFIPTGFPTGGGGGGAGGYGYGSGSGAGAYSYSSAGASGSGTGPQGAAPRGGAGAGGHHYSNTGSDSPNLFSRFGEAPGNNIQVSGNAAGPNGAFSSSSASSDGSGKVRYSVQSGRY